ncbi:MAG: acetylornithine deacetylase [Hyphomicrobiaceae bacterium]
MHGPTYSTKELLARLVAFDTTSHKSNMALVRFVEDYLAQHGIASHLVPTADSAKASLFATIGPSRGGGVALSGHTDVVPVNPQDWRTDPFVLTERDGKLYGRGTTDMKGFLACVLAAVPDFKRRALRKPIHIAFSYDEEIGCVGVRPMIGELGRSLPLPDLIVVGEPTGMAVVDAHKGPVRWRVRVGGLAAHSSMAPLGVNAIHYAARIIGELQHIEAELKAQPVDDRFDPPYATLQVTEIEGGTAANIVPVSCLLGFEVRALPGLDVAAIERRLRAFVEHTCLPEMRHVFPRADVEIELVNKVPPFAALPGSGAVALALQLAQQNETHAVSYATEAGLFQDKGPAAVVCGPGDIAQAHTANEFIATHELDRCSGFLTRLADWAETAI